MLWATWGGPTGKKMPMDAAPSQDPAAEVVLALRDGKTLFASKYDSQAHGPERNRYTLHWVTCEKAKQYRKQT